MKNQIKIFIWSISVILVFLLTFLFLVRKEKIDDRIEVFSFEECLDAGFPAMESYPRQCRDDFNNLFVEEIEIEKSDVLVDIKEGDWIESPLEISGEARGTWFFEGSFPVILTNWDGLIIAETYATAEGEWMTEDFVPFTATIEFEKPDLYDRGSLILQKDNPSGLSEFDDAYEIQIKFK